MLGRLRRALTAAVLMCVQLSAMIVAKCESMRGYCAYCSWFLKSPIYNYRSFFSELLFFCAFLFFVMGKGWRGIVFFVCMSHNHNTYEWNERLADISLNGSHEFWSEFQDETVYRVIVLLESVEQNFHDGDEQYEQAMAKLGDALSMMRPGDDISDRQQMLDVLAYTKTSRYLRILQALDQVTPGAASRVIAAAEQSKRDNETAQLFLKRNIIFERYRLMPRVLSSERLAFIVSALGD